MAAFMKRLGDALTPVKLSIDLRPGGVDLDAGTVVCQTGSLAVNGFPRTAYANGTIGATAAADVQLRRGRGDEHRRRNELVGVECGQCEPGLGAGQPVGQPVGPRREDARRRRQTVRFGLQLSRGGQAGTTDLTDSRCQVRVMIYSRTGTTSPL